MNKAGLEPQTLDPSAAHMLSSIIAAKGLTLLGVWPDYRGRKILSAIPGAHIRAVIQQMVQLVEGSLMPYVEAELNSKIVRAHRGDNPLALYQAWERAPFDGPNVVLLEFDFSDPEDEPPRNNDGREKCFWCGGPTKKIELATSSGNVCSRCGR